MGALRKAYGYPGVAQLVARVVWDHQAAGSNPVTRTRNRQDRKTFRPCRFSKTVEKQYMEKTELQKRAEDLAERCAMRGVVTNTGFLSPAEQQELSYMSLPQGAAKKLFGGGPGCERAVLFLLPEWEDVESFDGDGELCAVHYKSYFGAPGHRDYLGTILALGIRRDRVGDIRLSGEDAWVFCMKSVIPVLIGDLTRAGRYTVKGEACPLSAVPALQREVRSVRFTVKSPRLDAVLGDLFGLSRANAADDIREGLVSLNYAECFRTDAPIREGDVLSLKGKGKGQIVEIGGTTKKDRIFVNAEIWL